MLPDAEQLLFFSTLIEKLLLKGCLLLLGLLVCIQLFFHGNQEYQALRNKAIEYEGVVHQISEEAKATLQPR